MSRKILCVGGLHDGEHATWDGTQQPFVMHYIVPLSVSVSDTVFTANPPEMSHLNVRNTWYVPHYYQLDKFTRVAFAAPEGMDFRAALFHLFGGPV